MLKKTVLCFTFHYQPVCRMYRTSHSRVGWGRAHVSLLKTTNVGAELLVTAQKVFYLFIFFTAKPNGQFSTSLPTPTALCFGWFLLIPIGVASCLHHMLLFLTGCMPLWWCPKAVSSTSAGIIPWKTVKLMFLFLSKTKRISIVCCFHNFCYSLL